MRMASPPTRASLTSSTRMSRTVESSGTVSRAASSRAASSAWQKVAHSVWPPQFTAHYARAPRAARGRGRRMTVRVFVNERPVTVARGATVRDAVAALDGDLAGLLASGAAYATDGVGRPVDAADPIGEGGAIFRVVVTARQGPPRLSKELLRRWPKAELHVHLAGALRPQTMLELARAQGVRLPADTPDGLAQALSVKHAKNLEEYLTKYEITLSVMQTASALERIAYEFVLDAAADGVRYVEVRYSPLLHP